MSHSRTEQSLTTDRFGAPPDRTPQCRAPHSDPQPRQQIPVRPGEQTIVQGDLTRGALSADQPIISSAIASLQERQSHLPQPPSFLCRALILMSALSHQRRPQAPQEGLYRPLSASPRCVGPEADAGLSGVSQLHERDDDMTDNFGNARKQAALERITRGEHFLSSVFGSICSRLRLRG